MNKRWITPLLLLAVLASGGAADKPAEKTPKPDAPPACMRCGATCGLRPICVCRPGTKKESKVEFDVKCEPFCVPGCGSHIGTFGSRAPRVGCTSCREEPCACPGTVRFRKKLKAEKVDEEKPTIERTVAYVCRGCAAPSRVGCSDVDPPQQPARGWWSLPWWWPWQSGRH